MPNYILDLYYENAIPSFEAAKAAGLVGVIHKATEGVGFADPAYRERQAIFKGLGLLRGAYHLGHGGDPIGQAHWFLDHTQPDPDCRLALDWESVGYAPPMPVSEAESFCQELFNETGRWPFLYMANDYIDGRGTSLSNCPLWLNSHYRVLPAPLPVQWKRWTLWQYTDGVYGPLPRTLPGIGVNDLSLFNGTLPQLKRFWLGVKKPVDNTGLWDFLDRLKRLDKNVPIYAVIDDPSIDPDIEDAWMSDDMILAATRPRDDNPPPPPPTPAPTLPWLKANLEINVRASASQGSPILATIPTGWMFRVTKDAPVSGYLRLADYAGYVWQSSTTVLPDTSDRKLVTMYATDDGIHVRIAPSTNGTITDNLKRGQAIKVWADTPLKNNGFQWAQTEDGTHYVAATFLSPNP